MRKTSTTGPGNKVSEADLGPDPVRELVRELPAVLFVWKNAPGWPVDYVSDSVSGFGYEPKDFLSGRVTMETFVHPDDLAGLRKERRSHLRTSREAYRLEYRVLTSRGEVRWVEDRTRAIRAPSGRITAFHGVLLDVTPRHMMQQEIYEKETRYRILAETVGELVSLCSPDGKILYANSATARQFGLTPAAMVGKRQEDLFPPATAARRNLAIRRTAETGRPSAAEESDTLDFGQRKIRTATTLIPVPDAAGRIRSVMDVSRDVSERHRFEAALQASESRYRALFENNMAGCFVYELKRDGKGAVSDAVIREANQAATAITGLSAKQLIGKRVDDFGSKAPRQILAVLASVDADARSAAFDIHSDFLNRHFSCFAYPVARGTVALMFIDITDRKKTEAQMAEYRKQLLKLASENAMAEERERRRIAVALHDGVGQTLVLCKMQMEESRAAVVDESLATARLTSAIQAIETAITETRSLTFQLSPPVLHELGLVAAVEWLAENLSREHGFRIPVKTSGNAEPKSMTVRIMLFQGVRELVMNAIKHSQSSAVSIRLSAHGDSIVCSVRDDGKGFPSRALRAGAPRHDGMGLFNIRERLQLIGGNLKISSRPGRGTTAEITAPRELATEPLPNVKDPYEETTDRVM